MYNPLNTFLKLFWFAIFLGFCTTASQGAAVAVRHIGPSKNVVKRYVSKRLVPFERTQVMM